VAGEGAVPGFSCASSARWATTRRPRSRPAMSTTGAGRNGWARNRRTSAPSTTAWTQLTFPSSTVNLRYPTISWVGRIDPIKDLETLLRAFSLVHQVMPAARLRLFGTPRRAGNRTCRRCRTLAAELGIGEVATFEGPR